LLAKDPLIALRETLGPPFTPADTTAAPMTIAPSSAAQRSRNIMRPQTLAGVIGQGAAKRLISVGIQAARARNRPLDHVLLTGQSGTGKSTFAHVIANELGVRVFQFEAPLSHEALLLLRTTMVDGDVLFLDEIHQQALGDRRGRQATLQPETFYAVLEDRVLPTATGVLSFPAITMIGATTDPGRLPEAFLNRFPLRPRLEPYSERDLILMVARNAHVLDRRVKRNAARLIAQASRGIPREVNNLVRNVCMLPGDPIDVGMVREILNLNQIQEDGLTYDMQRMLVFLVTRAKRVVSGEARYQASVNTIATALGYSRDTRAISLYVEPWLIEQGLVQVGHGGRLLTDAGITRGLELANV
jgi:Holliday junction DNA helicase RuvB